MGMNLPSESTPSALEMRVRKVELKARAPLYIVMSIQLFSTHPP